MRSLPLGNKPWDAFVSHASEDKDAVARPIYEALSGMGAKIWFDEAQLEVGDSLLAEIDAGLVQSRYGIVILSKAFFKKHWTDYELRGLTSRELGRDKVVLPVWYGISRDEILERIPTLADKFALVADDDNILEVCWKLLSVMRPDLEDSISRQIAFRDLTRHSAKTSVPPKEIKTPSPRHETLPDQLLTRIRLIRAALLPVHPMSFSDWVEGFRIDVHPTREIEIWERIAAGFLEVVQSVECSKDESGLVYQFMLCVSTAPSALKGIADKMRDELRSVVLQTAYGKSPAFDVADRPRPIFDTSDDSIAKYFLEPLAGDAASIDRQIVERIDALREQTKKGK